MEKMKILTILYSFSFVYTNLIIIRKESGDQTNIHSGNCHNGGTFYYSSASHGCVYSPQEIGCQLYFKNHNDEIPSIDATHSIRKLKAHLPYHDGCDHAVMRIQYWDREKGKSVLKEVQGSKIRKTIRVKLKHGKFSPVVILNFAQHFPGLLLKLSFGCRDYGTSEYQPRNCLLVKFNGRANYPLTESYFDLSSKSTVLAAKKTTIAARNMVRSFLAPTSVAISRSPTITSSLMENTVKKKKNIARSFSSNFNRHVNKVIVTTISTALSTLKSEDPNSTTKRLGVFGKFGEINEHTQHNETTEKTMVIKDDNFTELKRSMAIIVVATLCFLVLIILCCTFFMKSNNDKNLSQKKKALTSRNEIKNLQDKTSNPLYEYFIGITPKAQRQTPLFSPYDEVKKELKTKPYFSRRPRSAHNNNKRVTEPKAVQNVHEAILEEEENDDTNPLLEKH